MLIQHNPNEGLKREVSPDDGNRLAGAHSAQPERGIETNTKFDLMVADTGAHSAQPERGIETGAGYADDGSKDSAHSAQPERGIETFRWMWRAAPTTVCSFSTTRTRD